MRHRPLVLLVSLPGATAASRAIFADVFAAANTVAQDLYHDSDAPADDTHVVTIEQVDVSSDDLSGDRSTQLADLIVLPACRGDSAPVSALRSWLRRQIDGGAMVSASGNAIFHLARSAALDGLRVAAPRSAWHALREKFPAILIDSEARISTHGNIWCAASPPDDFDLAIMLLAALTTTRFARLVAQECGLDRSNEAQIADVGRGALVENMRNVLKFRLGEQISIAQLATEFGIGLRTLNRRFHAETGQTPLEYLQEERIAVATRLLLKTNYRIERIANLVGYTDRVSFARVFKRLAGQSPHAWRLSGTVQ